MLLLILVFEGGFLLQPRLTKLLVLLPDFLPCAVLLGVNLLIELLKALSVSNHRLNFVFFFGDHLLVEDLFTSVDSADEVTILLLKASDCGGMLLIREILFLVSRLLLILQ